MANKKDLFDLFRESEQQLSERPSNDAWRRLEARLDDRKEKRKSSTLRQLMSVAAAVILLLTVGLALILQTKHQSKPLANVQMPSVLEDLSVYDTEVIEPLKVLEFTRKHVNRLANPVAEGTAGKRLIPNVQ